jgi:hypothetical protein
MNAILEGIRDQIAGDRASLEEMHVHSTPGTGGANNISDVEDSFDQYVGDIVDALAVDYDASEEAALACMREAIDELVSIGALPPVPGADDPEGTAMWLGKAKSAGLGGYVRKIAYDKMG